MCRFVLSFFLYLCAFPSYAFYSLSLPLSFCFIPELDLNYLPLVPSVLHIFTLVIYICCFTSFRCRVVRTLKQISHRRQVWTGKKGVLDEVYCTRRASNLDSQLDRWVEISFGHAGKLQQDAKKVQSGEVEERVGFYRSTLRYERIRVEKDEVCREGNPYQYACYRDSAAARHARASEEYLSTTILPRRYSTRKRILQYGGSNPIPR